MEAIRPFSTCEVSDALVKLGVESGGLISDVNMLSPSRDDASLKVCGPAFTVQMVHASTSKETHPSLSEHFVDAAPSGHIMVIASPPQSKSAVWGGLMTAGAKSRGVLAVIIDGRCRDLSEHRHMQFPVFARGQSTLGQGTFSRPSALGIPLTIQPRTDTNDTPLFPPTQVNSGDIIVADLDGVVCIPKDLVDRVAEICAKGRAIDEKCMADIQAGHGIKETFKKWRG